MLGIICQQSLIMMTAAAIVGLSTVARGTGSRIWRAAAVVAYVNLATYYGIGLPIVVVLGWKTRLGTDVIRWNAEYFFLLTTTAKHTLLFSTVSLSTHSLHCARQSQLHHQRRTIHYYFTYITRISLDRWTRYNNTDIDHKSSGESLNSYAGYGWPKELQLSPVISKHWRYGRGPKINNANNYRRARKIRSFLHLIIAALATPDQGMGSWHNKISRRPTPDQTVV